jgi:nanoRNase/pAp phosphatase (c-di-AMP/oligoRNAs hydrolase)
MTFAESKMYLQKHSLGTIAAKNRVINNIIDAFMSRNHFLILGHETPDEDCIASMVAVGLVLSKLNKTVQICTAEELPDHYHYLLQICRYNSIGVNQGDCEGSIDTVDTIIICDTPKPAMLEANSQVQKLLSRKDILKTEIDHHLETDSKFSGNDGYCLVTQASSTCELVGLLACKLSQRPEIREDEIVQDIFSRNMVLSILTGIIGDTQLGKALKSHKERRFYEMFSAMFGRMLTEKTTKKTNFFNMEQIFGELRRLSSKEERFHDYLTERSKSVPGVSFAVLSENESENMHKEYDHDTIIAVARGVADELAEQSGFVSVVGYYDQADSSPLVQFRARRSFDFQDYDLRKVLQRLEIENGGGHEGAIGFRLDRSEIPDFGAYVDKVITTIQEELRAEGHLPK